MKLERLGCDRGQSTLEYMMVLGLMTTIAILATQWLLDVLLLTVSRLAVQIAVSLSTFP